MRKYQRPDAAELDLRLQELKPGDHLCCIYESEADHRALLTPFISQGVHQNQKVIYLFHEHTSEDILEYLRRDGQEFKSFQKKGQLQILAANEFYLRDASFDPEGMISLLKQETKRALDEGYSALRVTGEMSWALKRQPDSERLIEYEAKLNDFFPRHKCLAICQYNKRLFTPEILLDVLSTHPIAIIGTRFYDNPYYISPQDLLGPDPEAARLNNWLQNLESLGKSKDVMAERVAESQQIAWIGNWWWDIEKDVTRWSTQLYKIFGADPGKVKPSKDTFLERVHPDDRPRMEKAIAKLLSSGKAFALDHRILLPNGSVRFLHSVARLEHDINNKPVSLYGIAQDITERKQTELDLKTKELALASSISGIGITDLEGTLIYVNDSLVKMWGYSHADEILNRSLIEFWEGEGVLKTVEALRTKGWRIGEDLGKRKDGSIFPVQFYASMIKDEEGNPLYMLGSFIDISEQKRIEEESQRLRSELAHLDRVVTMGALTGAIAHEINQPLAAIMSNAHAAQRYLIPEQLDIQEAQEALQDIITDTERAGEMIHRVRALVIKEERTHETIDLNTIVSEVMQVIHSEALLYNASVIEDLDQKIPSFLGDRIQLQQVILNLLMNALDAVKASPAGNGEIVISTRNEGDAGVRVTITDTGPGISAENLDDIFKPFYSTKPQGMGLGLSLCHSIIESFGGQMHAKNRPGGGAEVSFWLPKNQ